jgi:hypothetical protein
MNPFRRNRVDSRLGRPDHSQRSDAASGEIDTSSEGSLARRARTVVLVLLTSVTMAATAATDRPRIGLVLAGGGAKGGAHVGVIQVLEELRVPIDCIAGTSMGTLVFCCRD